MCYLICWKESDIPHSHKVIRHHKIWEQIKTTQWTFLGPLTDYPNLIPVQVLFLKASTLKTPFLPLLNIPLQHHTTILWAAGHHLEKCRQAQRASKGPLVSMASPQGALLKISCLMSELKNWFWWTGKWGPVDCFNLTGLERLSCVWTGHSCSALWALHN